MSSYDYRVCACAIQNTHRRVSPPEPAAVPYTSVMYTIPARTLRTVTPENAAVKFRHLGSHESNKDRAPLKTNTMRLVILKLTHLLVTFLILKVFNIVDRTNS